jgi:methylmalonyl-CoA mutase cobalamin-binding subunit
MMPLLTLGLFVVLELVCNNVMEPWLYGSSTGVSPIALIFAAVCWTWLWGPVGLVLATPMTVCLVVMGRHIPRLSFLSVLLSNEEALTPAEDCYYRLLTIGDQDEMELVESYLKAHSLTALYDSVLIPVITAAEIDHRLELLDDAQLEHVEHSLRDIVEDLGACPPARPRIEPDKAAAANASTPTCHVYCLPARADRDELAGTMLAQLLRQEGLEAQSAPTKLDVEELIGLVKKAVVDVVCISVVAPSTVLHARYLCLKLRGLLPKQRIVVGLWGATENVAYAARRVRDSGADEVFTTLAQAVLQLATIPIQQTAHQLSQTTDAL